MWCKDCNSDRSDISEACEDCDSDRSDIFEACKDCYSDISGISEACEDCNSDISNTFETCEDCDLDRSGISEACEDYGSSRLGVFDACDDGIDGSGIRGYVGSLEIIGAAARSSGETLPNFRQKSSLKFFGFGLEGQFGRLCLAPARCRTRKGFGSDFKVKFGYGPVTYTSK
ncbi:unnamed protein product [Prunus armeniaca]